MHSSITAHIVGDYLIDEATLTWGPNLEMFNWRLGNPDVKDRWVEWRVRVALVLGVAGVRSEVRERQSFGIPV
jgi:hypothetical protein